VVISVVERRVNFSDVLRVREFRAIWLADAQSAAGDQLARVALSLLVFERTSSSALTALTYALTFLPALVGGALLSGLADRYSRRSVMIACDVLRAGFIGLMIIPGLQLWALCAALVLAVLAGSPFVAAENALIPDILEGDRFVVSSGLRGITNQIAQLAGFALGGIAVAAIGARSALAIDALTFAVSAVLIRAGVRQRPRPGSEGDHQSYFSMIGEGIRLVAADPLLRTLLGLCWLAGFYVIPEALAAPYAGLIGAGPVAVGLLMAAPPAGTALGTYLFVRLVSADSRPSWIGPLAVAIGIPFALCAIRPPLAVSLALWAVAGMAMAYQVQVMSSFVRAVPAERRGQAVGIGASGLLAIQGIGVLLGGIVASKWNASAAIALAGIVQAVVASALTFGYRRQVRQRGPVAKHRQTPARL
jgi:predicted MFS family arabinose efflux permease